MSEPLTYYQRAALRQLASLHDRFPERSAFRSRVFGQLAAMRLREVEHLGLVSIDKSSHAFRYAITDAGRQATERLLP